MPLITLLTDLGTKDFHLAAIKGAILSQYNAFVPMVDISHEVKPFDIKEAAHILKNSFHHFPKGTIHLVHVSGSSSNKLLLCEIAGHYIITFDTGIFSIAFEKSQCKIFEVNEEIIDTHSLLHEQSIARTIDFLLKEYLPTDFAHPAGSIKEFRLLQPMTMQGNIRGTVVYIDNYGNCISNISRKMVEDHFGDRKVSVNSNVGLASGISKNYSDVEEGEIVCLYNSSGFLEIAINRAQAEKLLGIKIDTPVMIMPE
jgi:hypothetical protein